MEIKFNLILQIFSQKLNLKRRKMDTEIASFVFVCLLVQLIYGK